MDRQSNRDKSVTVSRRLVVGSAVGLVAMALPAASVSASTVGASGTTVPAGDDFDVSINSVTTNTTGGATVEYS
jgi:hypothetical protein